MPYENPRTKNLVIRCTQAERDWFYAVAEAQEIPLSVMVRQYLAVEGARLGVPVPASLAS